MIMRSPIVAMLWENWRLTRVEAAQRLGFGLVAGSAALTFSSAGADIAFWILITVHGMVVWLSILKLNGGRFMDGYKPGFPFYLLYARPVPTVVFVSVAMLYDAISCAALYVVSAALLGFAFGKPLPLFSVTLWIVAFHFSYMLVQWSTRSRTVQWVGSFVFCVPLFFLLKIRVASPPQAEFSLVDNAVMVLTCLVSFGLTVVGVVRQRRGDAVASVPRAAGSSGYPDWLVALFRLACPTSSATRALVWFELKSSGLPALTIGFGIAILTFVVCVISTSLGNVGFAAIPLVILALPVVLFTLGGNAFGIRRKQGRTYASAFELTQPYGTAQLAGLKVLVRAACVLVALIAISASLWASSSILSEWGQVAMNNNKDALPGLLKLRQKVELAFGGLTGYAHVAQVVLASIAVTAIVGWQATREAVRARYPRLLLVVQWLPAVWGLAIILLTLAVRNGIVPVSLMSSIFTATFWVSGAAIVLATIYLFWSGFAERVLTIRYACGALTISLAFGAAWLAGMPGSNIVGILWPVLLILMVGVLAPWSLNRVRHA